MNITHNLQIHLLQVEVKTFQAKNFLVHARFGRKDQKH